MCTQYLYIDPDLIKFVTPATEFCDYTQFNSNTNHPHAGIDRGVFYDHNRSSPIIRTQDWDSPLTTRFNELYEHIALHDYIVNGMHWSNSIFAHRNLDYMSHCGCSNRGFETPKSFIKNRILEIDKLIDSIDRNGVLESNAQDSITVNITRNSEIVFNNRGHHRLSIAKILGVRLIPVLVNVVYTQKSFAQFLLEINNVCES
jgi:hypothetical protein